MTKQQVKDFFVRILRNPFVKTPVIAFSIVVAVVLFFFIFMFFFTRHGQGIDVPKFSGLTEQQAIKLAGKHSLRLEITDSVYIMTRKPGTIVEQNPAEGSKVKSNRKIFLTINANAPKLIELPNVVGVTLRQAKAILELQGFTIETLYFTSDIAINNVLEQRIKGKKIASGTLLPKGSSIDLLLGKGFGYERTALPRVIGFNLSDAKNIIIEASLNLGNITYDETVKDLRDSLQAKVYSQYPASLEEMPINFGAKVDLWLTINESRIPRIAEVKDSTENEIIFEEPEEEVLE